MRYLYYCNECGKINEPNDIIRGSAKSADEYKNDSCPCGSEDITLILASDICPVCGDYHSEDDIAEKELCFWEIYSDARGQLYIMKYWNAIDFYRTMADLSDEGRNDTIQTIIWKSLVENNEVMKFLRFVCEFDDAKGDIRRDLRYIGALAESGGIYELIDTNEAVKTAV